MSLQGFFRPIPVIVEEFFTGFNGVLGDQDEAGHIVNHDNFGDTVGADTRVIDQTAESATLACGVNTGNNQKLNFLFPINSSETYQYCFPLCLK